MKTATRFILDKFGIIKGSTYKPPVLTLSQASGMMEQYAKEKVKEYNRELLIGYSKEVLKENYKAFEDMELKRIDKYLATV